MNNSTILMLLLVTTAYGDVISISKDTDEEETYTVRSDGPILGQDIVSVYREAEDFCAKNDKELATVELKQDPERQTVMHKWLYAELTFKCALKTTQCTTVAPAGSRVFALSSDITLKDGTVVHSGDMQLKDGTIIRWHQCSDAERLREPPPP